MIVTVPRWFLSSRRVLFGVRRHHDASEVPEGMVELHFTNQVVIRWWARPLIWLAWIYQREGFAKDGVGL